MVLTGKVEQPNNLDELSKWLLSKMKKCQESYHKLFDKEDHAGALEVLEKFFWSDFCDNYLELVKDQVFNPDRYDQGVADSYTFGMYTVGLEILKMYAPVIPFVTESIYQHVFRATQKADSIHNAQFSKEVFSQFSFDAEEKIIDNMIKAVSAVRKLKSENEVSLKTSLAKLHIHSHDTAVLDQIVSVGVLLEGVTNAHSVVTSNSKLEQDEIIETEPGLVANIVLE